MDGWTELHFSKILHVALLVCAAQQVQTDPNTSTESLQVEMRELDKRLEAMEQRGVELEQNLRDCTDGSPICS